MAVKLPEAFLTRMSELLGEEFKCFMASYEEPRYYGLRSNPLKITSSMLMDKGLFQLEPVPWAAEGFYYGEGERPGKHPYYHAGLYYIQEPSAMLPAELLEVRPGDRVLDLCAAPGGKTTQLAGKLQGRGLLVANDNNAERVRVLARNVELFGIRNALVVNETPDRLATRWAGCFDRILIDAPCSGEGMFRKEEDMARQWERHSVTKCSLMQQDILRDAAALLAPGGRIVYSTCTFAPEENECRIAEFLRNNPEFTIVPQKADYGFRSGNPQWAAAAEGLEQPDEAAAATAGTLRLWPHHIKGEGHYVAVLDKADNANGKEKEFMEAGLPVRQGKREDATKRKKKAAPSAPVRGGASATDPLELWHTFQSEVLTTPLEGQPTLFGEHLYLTPPGAPPIDGIKVSRPGWFVGSLKKGRFEPSQALAMALTPGEVRRSYSMSPDGEEIKRYLKGETLFAQAQQLVTSHTGGSLKGYVLMCVEQHPVGWAKYTPDGMLKNEYPAAWRLI